MKILIDECLPSELKEALAAMGHESHTVRQAGFGSKKNGELLTIAESRQRSQYQISAEHDWTQGLDHNPARQVQSHEGSVPAYARLRKPSWLSSPVKWSKSARSSQMPTQSATRV